MTTFALDYDHATALAKDLERAAIDVREPAAPPVDLSLPAHAAGHQEFLSAMQRASSVTAMQSRQLAQRLSAMLPWQKMPRELGSIRLPTPCRRLRRCADECCGNRKPH